MKNFLNILGLKSPMTITKKNTSKRVAKKNNNSYIDQSNHYAPPTVVPVYIKDLRTQAEEWFDRRKDISDGIEDKAITKDMKKLREAFIGAIYELGLLPPDNKCEKILKKLEGKWK